MIQVTPQMRIFVAVDACDFRCQIDGLSAICRQVFDEDPLSGSLFVFRNRTRTAVKILYFDGDAYWLCHRRLAKGRLRWWPHEGSLSQIDERELLVLLHNGDPRGVFGEPWKRLAGAKQDEAQGRGSGRSQGSYP